MNKLTYHVISHTHWDREWYEPLEVFRIQLVDLMDHLLELLERDPRFIFHMDGQACTPDDYLEIRPQQRAAVEKHVRAGRIIIGPWYVQNDFFLVSGEATIRNLLLGRRTAQSFGRCDNVGYMPDQFGLISQLPQILRGFGMESAVFARGIAFGDGPEWQRLPQHSEFTWKSGDGSAVLAIFLPCWYNNAQRFSADPDKAFRYLGMIKERALQRARTPHLLLMNGVDQIEAQEDLLPILRKLNERLSPGEHILQTTLAKYVKAVESALAGKKPEFYTGELRFGPDVLILQGTLSSRSHLKRANAHAQAVLEKHLEPLSVIALACGFPAREYDQDYLNYLWKLLIVNHAHDSICGGSQDAVPHDMENRYERIEECAARLIERRMDLLAAHIEPAGMDPGEYRLTVFNTAPRDRSGVVFAQIDIPVEEDRGALEIINDRGAAQTFHVLATRVKDRSIRSPINLPGNMKVVSRRIEILAGDVPAMGWRRYRVRPVAPGALTARAPAARSLKLENEFLRVTVTPGGRVDLYDKRLRRTFRDVLWLEDTGDLGDAFNFVRDGSDPLTSRKPKPSVARAADSPLRSVLRLHYDWMLPAEADRTTGHRAAARVCNPIDVELTLDRSAEALHIRITIDNRSRDHRLRAVIHTGIAGTITSASSPFDVIFRDQKDPYKKGSEDRSEPTSEFVNLDAGGFGFAVLFRGLYEYEHYSGPGGRIGITLVRGTGYINVKAGVPTDETWITPENQCLRRITQEFALFPHAGDVFSAYVPRVAADFNNSMLVHFDSANPRKFTGGRPCVQETDLAEIFYRPDPYRRIRLPVEASCVRFSNPNIVLTACKKAERGNRLILRFYNPTPIPQTMEVVFGSRIRSVWRVDLREIRQIPIRHRSNEFRGLRLRSKEIATLEVGLSPRG